jgi:hypothetical protein
MMPDSLTKWHRPVQAGQYKELPLGIHAYGKLPSNTCLDSAVQDQLRPSHRFCATVGLRQMRLLRPAETTEEFMTTVFDPAEPQRITPFFSMPAARADRLRGLTTLANDWSSESGSATTVLCKGRNS